MNTIDYLANTADIHRLKAKYCRAVDTQDWKEWREVFTQDAVMLLPELGAEFCVNGVDAIIDHVREMLSGATTVHHVHCPEIEFIDDNHANGIWALDDQIRWPSASGRKYKWSTLRGAGHYHEKYLRTDKGWKIAELRITRLYLDRE